jgi:Cu-Zn family superoxide dismutase
MSRFAVTVLVVGGLFFTSGTAPQSAPATQAPTPSQPTALVRYELPPDITYPEGIAYDPASHAFYTASAVTGAVVRVDMKTRRTTTIVPAGDGLFPAQPFPSRLGMKLDQAGRLWIAGGRTGRMALVKGSDGTVLRRFETPTSKESLINDVALVGLAGYFTDSFVPTLWRVQTTGDTIGELEPWLQFKGTPIEYANGPNLNGIAATANGADLIVVQMNKGLLFRVHIADKRVTPIDTHGEDLTAADGLVLDGRTLYLVRQSAQEVVTLDLANDLSNAHVVHRFRDPAFLWTATAAKAGDQLLIVNTQFNKRESNSPVTPFTVVAVPIARLRQ